MASIPQLVISTGNLQKRIEQWVALESLPDTKSSKKRELSLKHARPDVSVAYVAPRNENEQEVAEIWQQLLGIQRIGIHDDYFELGGDSLLATQIIYRIRERFNVEVPLDKFFEDVTVAALAERVGALLWLKQSQLKASKGVQEDYEEI
jgi:acyl carrier protein